MVMMVQPVVECVEAVRPQAAGPGTPGHAHAPGAKARPGHGGTVGRHSSESCCLCGRYEGFDERIRLLLEPEEISIGDFVLNGGEVAAMVMIDAVIRLVPGVLGHEDSSQEDSFSGAGRLLEFPQYTRPREFRGLEVPSVLLDGNHEEIARWRETLRRQRTRQRRPDLLPPAEDMTITQGLSRFSQLRKWDCPFPEG